MLPFTRIKQVRYQHKVNHWSNNKYCSLSIYFVLRNYKAFPLFIHSYTFCSDGIGGIISLCQEAAEKPFMLQNEDSVLYAIKNTPLVCLISIQP